MIDVGWGARGSTQVRSCLAIRDLTKQEESDQDAAQSRPRDYAANALIKSTPFLAMAGEATQYEVCISALPP